MDSITCPVCGTGHTVGELCPECGFEARLYADIPSEEVRHYESERIAAAKRLWDELTALRQKSGSGTAPVGFLITDNLVVYCIYEGINIFGIGAVPQQQDAHYNNMLIPGIPMLPEHFTIQVAKTGEKKKNQFTIGCSAPAETAVFLNTLTDRVGPEPVVLNSGDEVLLSAGQTEVELRLKFRKNIS